MDERERQLTCTVFFGMMVLAVGPGGLVSLSAMVTAGVTACVMAALGATKAVSSKDAISDNFERRPWQLFDAVLQHLLAAYATLFATPQGSEVLELIRTLNPLAGRCHGHAGGQPAHLDFSCHPHGPLPTVGSGEAAHGLSPAAGGA